MVCVSESGRVEVVVALFLFYSARFSSSKAARGRGGRGREAQRNGRQICDRAHYGERQSKKLRQ